MSGEVRRVAVIRSAAARAVQRATFAACLSIAVAAGAAEVTPAPDADTSPRVPHADFVRTILVQHFVPAAQRFVEASSALAKSVDRACASRTEAALGEARDAWTMAARAWDALDAVEYATVLDRRSFFQIDFWPTRPFAIDIVVRSFPDSARTLDIVSAAAKGLPALEYLLWPQAAGVPVFQPGHECEYARVVAGGVHAESVAVEVGFRAAAADDLDAPRARERLTQLVNQLFGAIEALRGKALMRPAVTRDPKLFPRQTSGDTVRYWSVRWSTVRGLLVGEQGPGATGIARHLREIGEGGAAERLEAAVASTDAVLRDIREATPESAAGAAKALVPTEQSLDKDVAPALHVTIGFRGADGD